VAVLRSLSIRVVLVHGASAQIHALAEEQIKTAMQAIGYRQVVEHLRGGRALAETIGLVKSRTRQFAKRQLTWFRRQLESEWIELKPDEPPENCLRNFFETVR